MNLFLFNPATRLSSNLLTNFLRVFMFFIVMISDASLCAKNQTGDLIFKVLTAGSSGSSFIVGPAENGKCLFVTAYHVISDNNPSEAIILASPEGHEYELNIKSFKYDEQIDLAFSEAPNCNNSIGIPMAKASAITVSTKVLVFGHPLSDDHEAGKNSDPLIVFGRITHYDNGYEYDISYDALTKPGMSGGPVINSDGSELLAIHGRTDSAGNANNLQTRERLRLGGRGISAPLLYRFLKKHGYNLPRSSKMTCLVGVC